jgi:hypothetical protein
MLDKGNQDFVGCELRSHKGIIHQKTSVNASPCQSVRNIHSSGHEISCIRGLRVRT